MAIAVSATLLASTALALTTKGSAAAETPEPPADGASAPERDPGGSSSTVQAFEPFDSIAR